MRIISKDPRYLIYNDSDKSQLFSPAKTGKNRDGAKFRNYSVTIDDDVLTTNSKDSFVKILVP